MTGYKTDVGGADTVFPFTNIKSVLGSFRLVTVYSGSTESYITVPTLRKKYIEVSCSNYYNSVTVEIGGGSFNVGKHSVIGVDSVVIKAKYAGISGVMAGSSSGTYKLFD